MPTDSPGKHVRSYSIDTSLLRSGDIIFRKGNSLISQMVLLADGNSPYSHTGIIKIIYGKVFVIHSVPAEELGEEDIVKIEPIKDFLRSDRASAIAVYRLNSKDDSLGVSASDYAYDFQKKKIHFDSSFDLKDDKRLYCTELVWKAYLKAGTDLIENKYDNIKLPFTDGPYILPGNLLESKQLTNIYSINFQ